VRERLYGHYHQSAPPLSLQQAEELYWLAHPMAAESGAEEQDNEGDEDVMKYQAIAREIDSTEPIILQCPCAYAILGSD